MGKSEGSDGKLFDQKHQKFVPFTIREEMELRNISVTAASSMLRLTRGGQTLVEVIQDTWTTFDLGHPTYSTVAWAKKSGTTNGTAELRPIVIQVRYCTESLFSPIDVLMCLIFKDNGKLDGVRRVIFGGSIRHWVNKLLLLDAISWLSNHRIATSLTRHVLVDIDDVFVGKNRFQPDDVRALVESQTRLAAMVPGFTYNLGFSGGEFVLF